jgi:hypothetical protein
MRYVSEWERLSEALTRVVAATQLSSDEARIDICQAIAEGAVEIRGKLRKHMSRPVRPPKTVVRGNNFRIPAELSPEDFDWERSRPVKLWAVQREISPLPGLWEVEWIELFKANVTRIWCPAGERSDTAQKASKKPGAKSRTQPASERVLRVLRQLFPPKGDLPEQAILPNKTLCRQVSEKLREQALPGVSNDTILRAAGRRK